MNDKVFTEMASAEIKAWKALGGYKFWMFGYYAAKWVNLNKLLSKKDRLSSPFKAAVRLAREQSNFISLQNQTMPLFPKESAEIKESN